MTAQGERSVYESGECEIDLARRELRARGVPAPVGARAFEIIEVLLKSAGKLVTKHDLMDLVWPGAIVDENTLQVHISAVRKALGPYRGMLKTASGRGYCLLGTWTLKGGDLPPERSDAAPRQIAAATYAMDFPAPAFQLIGRTSALLRLHDLLSAYRIVTLTGPGGIGKTVLALEAARGLFPSFEGEGRLVELVSLSDPSLVSSAVARALGLRLSGDEAHAEAVARAIGEKKLLLVLDNCEHLINTTAKLVEAIVHLCPRTTVVATSQEPLRVEGEYIYRVPPLDIPVQLGAKPGDVLGHSAVQLLIARTRVLDSDFTPDAEDLPAIGAICRHLDGIPLAIEFAAARAAVLGFQQVASRLDDRFKLLTNGRRTALPRHQTLRATLDWSYDLLPETDAAMLRRLGVFVGDFSLDAAIAVAGDLPAPLVVEYIGNLVAKSLIVADLREQTAQYRLLDTTRLYALEKLRGSLEYREAARRHAEYYQALYGEAEAESKTRTEADWLAIYGRHLDNVRAALDWAFSPDGDAGIAVALTVGIVPLWFQLSLMNECRERAGQAIQAYQKLPNGSPRIEMRLSAAIATSLFYTQGATPEIDTAWTRALEIAERLDETDYQLRALWGLWSYRISVGDYPTANTLAQRFRGIAARSNDAGDKLIGERMIGGALHFLGDQRAARHHIDLMLEAYDASSRQPHIIRFHYDQQLAARVTLARILWLQGFVDQAMRTAGAAVEEARATEQPISLCFALAEAACPIALFAGDLITADYYVETLLAHSAKHALPVFHTRGLGAKGLLSTRRGDSATGARSIQAALQDLSKTGYHAYPMLLGSQAEALGAIGQVDDGLAAIESALSRCERNGERWYIPDLLRVRAELLLQQAADQAISRAEDYLRQSIDVAQEQGALFWELRAALSLARLRLTQDRRGDAKEVLVPVYEHFTEGFDIADMRSARAMLASLSVA